MPATKYGTIFHSMTIMTTIQDKMTPYLEIIHQTLAIVPGCFNELMLGMGLGWPAPTLHKLTSPGSEMPLNAQQCSWIGSLMNLGAIFGPILSVLFLDTLGRKFLLRGCALTFFVASLLIVFYKNVWSIYLLRVLLGIAMGAGDSSSSIYMAEISAPKIRAFFCGLTIVGSYSGQLFEFIITGYFSFDDVAITNAAICFVGLVSTVFLIESPYFLIMKGDLKKAQKNYLWIKGTDKWQDVSVEFEQIRQNLENERLKRQSYMNLLKDEVNRRSSVVVLTLAASTWTTGYPAIISFPFKIFASNDTLSLNEFIILLGVIQIAASLVTVLIIERFNRKTLLLGCYALSAFLHLVSATLCFIHQRITPIEGFSWLIFISVSSYMATYVLLYSVVHTIRGELFPQSVKAIGGAVSVVVESISAFLIANVFLQVCEMFGVYCNFLFYFLISVGAFVFVYFKLPETRGETLVGIQKFIASECVPAP